MESPSRTKKKKIAQALQKLGERLVQLGDAQFAALSLPEALLEAVAMARQMKSHGAKRRQLQYIGRLMRAYDPADIEKALERITAGEDEKKRHFKRVERWRDELVDGDEERLAWLAEHCPSIDLQKLGELVGNAQTAHSDADKKKAGRLLFRYLTRVCAD
jgi:ribosome-associated protein